MCLSIVVETAERARKIALENLFEHTAQVFSFVIYSLLSLCVACRRVLARRSQLRFREFLIHFHKWI